MLLTDFANMEPLTKVITFHGVQEAYSRIKESIYKTEVIVSQDFNRLHGRNFYFKAENEQLTHSFKIRGALNAVLALKERGSTLPGMVTRSSGNHGIALAYAGKQFGIPVTVVCSSQLTKEREKVMTDLGAEVIRVGTMISERIDAVKKIEKERRYIYIASSDNDDVIAGQGTVALELLEQVPHVDAILVAVCGGSLAAGICIVLKALKPNVKVYLCEPYGKNAEKSLKAGKRLWSNPPKMIDTVVCGLRGEQIYEKNWTYILSHAEKKVFTVSDVEAIEGVNVARELLRSKVEIAAGLTVSAAASRECRCLPAHIQHVAVILCGGNCM